MLTWLIITSLLHFLLFFCIYNPTCSMQKRRFSNILINSRPIFLYSKRITDMWKSGESSISRRKQKEKSQCQRLPNRERPVSLPRKRSFQKLKMKAGWTLRREGRKRQPVPKIFTHTCIFRKREIDGYAGCMEN